MGEARRRELRELLISRPKWVLASASSAYKHALREVLAEPSVGARVADTRAAAETLALRTFLELMAAQPERVTYGYAHVQYAASQGAVDKLLLADTLFRAQHVQRRQKHVALVEEARAAGAHVHIFSDLHASGEQLAKLSGVAATLRYPMPIEDILADEGEDEGEDDGDGGDDDQHAQLEGDEQVAAQLTRAQ